MSLFKRHFILSFLLPTLLIQACVPENSRSEEDRAIKIRESIEPASINPFYIRDEVGYYIAGQIFQPLLAIDYKTEELVGILAEGRPQLSSNSSWGMIIDYRLRKNVQFSNGNPLTVKDILYSIKANICPLTNPYFHSYYQFIDSVSIDPMDSNHFTFYTKETYYLSEYTSGDYYIISEEQFDPQHLLRNYSLQQLKAMNDLASEPSIAAHADQIKSLTFRDSLSPIGSGAYELKEWNNNDRLELELKQDWWGNSYAQSNTFFLANAKELDFYFIEDAITSLNALKNKEFDLMRSIPPKDFSDLESNTKFNKDYRLLANEKFGFQYLGFNLRNELLKNIELRKAIAYSLPQKEIVDQLYYGYAINATSMFTNDTKGLLSYEKNIDSANFYMGQFLEKHPESTLELKFAYNAGNDMRKSIGLILKEALKEINIDLSIEQYEWSVYLKKLKSGEFELFMNGMLTSSFTPDLINSLHTNAIEGGKNYFGLSNPRCDTLLESIGIELDQNKRAMLFNELEIIVNHRLPLLVLVKQMEPIAISKKLKNPNTYRLRPNYWAAEMSK